MIKPVFGPLQAALSSTTTRYFPYEAGGGPGLPTALIRANAPIAVAGTINNLVMTLSGAPGVGTSYTATLYKNSSATTLTVTVSDTATQAVDSSHPITVAPGDLLGWVIVPTAAPAVVNVFIATTFEGTNAGETPMVAGWDPASNSAIEYRPLFGSGGSSSIEARVAVPFPTSGTIDQLYLRHSSTPGGVASYTVTLFKNGSATALSASVVGASNTSNNLVDSVTVVPGDLLSIEVAPSGTPTSSIPFIGMRFRPTIDGESPFLARWTSTSNVTQRYGPPHGTSVTSPTETIMASVVPIGFTLKNMYVAHGAAPGAGKSWTYNSRVNLSAGNLTVNLADAAVTGSDTTGSDTLAALDLLAVGRIGTGTPADSLSSTFSAVAYISTGPPPTPSAFQPRVMII